MADLDARCERDIGNQDARLHDEAASILFNEKGIAMLVLSRKVGEKIMIGDNIVLEVVDIRGNNVRLAVTAPKGVQVWREELYKLMNDDKE